MKNFKHNDPTTWRVSGMRCSHGRDMPLFHFGEDPGVTDNDWWNKETRQENSLLSRYSLTLTEPCSPSVFPTVLYTEQRGYCSSSFSRLQ